MREGGGYVVSGSPNTGIPRGGVAAGKRGVKNSLRIRARLIPYLPYAAYIIYVSSALLYNRPGCCCRCPPLLLLLLLLL